MRRPIVFCLLIGLLLFLIAMPISFAADSWINSSSTQIQPGENISFNGRIYVLRCTNPSYFIRVLLKTPVGRYVVSPSYIDFSYVDDTQTLKMTNGYDYKVYYNFNGALHTTSEWVPGEYQLIVDAPYKCNAINNLYDGDKLETISFNIISNTLNNSWKWNENYQSNWWNTTYNDSQWLTGEAPFGNYRQYPDEKTVWMGKYSYISGMGYRTTGQSDGYFRKDINTNNFIPAKLEFEFESAANCYFNGAHIDSITGSGVRPGHCNSGYDSYKIDVIHDVTWNDVNCNKTYQNHWEIDVNFIPTKNIISCDIKTLDKMYTYWDSWGPYDMPGKAWFDPKINFYGPTEIKWSNNYDYRWYKLNYSADYWYVGEIPITDNQWYLKGPDYYNSDGKINWGIAPWTNSVTYFRKWVGYNSSEKWLLFASTLKPECYINEQKINIVENEHDWWVFKSNISGLLQPGANLIACSVKSNRDFNYFDFILAEKAPEIIPPVPPSPTNEHIGFMPMSGSSNNDNNGSDNESSLNMLGIIGGAIAVGGLGLGAYLWKGNSLDYLDKIQGSMNNIEGYLGISPRQSFFAKVKQMGAAYHEKVAEMKLEDKEWDKLKKQANELKEQELQTKSFNLTTNFLNSLNGMSKEEKVDAILEFLNDNQTNLTDEDKSLLWNMRHDLWCAETDKKANSNTKETSTKDNEDSPLRKLMNIENWQKALLGLGAQTGVFLFEELPQAVGDIWDAFKYTLENPVSAINIYAEINQKANQEESAYLEEFLKNPIGSISSAVTAYQEAWAKDPTKTLSDTLYVIGGIVSFIVPPLGAALIGVGAIAQASQDVKDYNEDYYYDEFYSDVYDNSEHTMKYLGLATDSVLNDILPEDMANYLTYAKTMKETIEFGKEYTNPAKDTNAILAPVGLPYSRYDIE